MTAPSAPRVLRLLSRCPFQNLATEEALFAALPRDGRLLLFYENAPAVVVGRTQNPFYEADLAHAATAPLAVLRRRSGGGAVVHGQGNLNLSFMAPAPAFDPPGNVARVSAALARLGVPRDAVGGSARGDITVRGKKVSGSAYRFSGGRSYHHATLLVDSDLPALRRALRSPLRPRLAVSGAASVRSEVTNVADEAAGDEAADRVATASRRLDVDTVVDAVAREFGSRVVDEVGPRGEGLEGLVEAGAVAKEAAVLRSRDWVYGQCPRFSARFSWDEVGARHGEHVALFMGKGCVVEAVQRVRGGTAAGASADSGAFAELVFGSAPGKGSLGAGDEQLTWTEGAELIVGAPFSKSGLLRKLVHAGEDGAIMRRIAAYLPELHVG